MTTAKFKGFPEFWDANLYTSTEDELVYMDVYEYDHVQGVTHWITNYSAGFHPVVPEGYAVDDDEGVWFTEYESLPDWLAIQLTKFLDDEHKED